MNDYENLIAYAKASNMMEAPFQSVINSYNDYIGDYFLELQGNDD